MADGQGLVHLIGSFPKTPTINDARDVFEIAGPILGESASRLPDGEPQGWINFSTDAFNRASGVERVPGGEPEVAPPYMDTRELKERLLNPELRQKSMAPAFRIQAGRKAEDVKFAPSGYVEIAKASYAAFAELRAAGKIAPGTRFQQSMPTPSLMLGSFVPEDRAALLPHFEQHLFAEVAQICNSIPHEDFAFQWDVVEVSRLPQEDGALDTPEVRARLADLASQIARACNAVPESVDMGVHLCYGNAGGRHSIQPRDTGVMVAYANAFIPHLTRRLDWLHMPVPIDRDDEAYFAPLQGLQLPTPTAFFLGLVHPADGIEGARRRITTAKRFVSRFGVATECGLRFFPDTDIPDILRLHADAAKLAEEPVGAVA